ncbi:hypothetical protein G6F57_019005 [Rhizopus arrhizus]|nr:hypothetical protein G6F57_019005 [Rhizopus arrhizus]
MIVVDKNTTALLRLSDRNVILDKGATVWRGRQGSAGHRRGGWYRAGDCAAFRGRGRLRAAGGPQGSRTDGGRARAGRAGGGLRGRRDRPGRSQGAGRRLRCALGRSGHLRLQCRGDPRGGLPGPDAGRPGRRHECERARHLPGGPGCGAGDRRGRPAERRDRDAVVDDGGTGDAGPAGLRRQQGGGAADDQVDGVVAGAAWHTGERDRAGQH